MKSCLLGLAAFVVSACGARSGLLNLAPENSAGTVNVGGAPGMTVALPVAGNPPVAAGAGGMQNSDGTTSSGGAPHGIGGAQGKPVVQKAISAGTDNTCGLQVDGTVWCWGANDRGQLGNGTTTALSSVPVQVTGITSAIAITSGGAWNAGGKGAARSSYNCAVLRDGTVRCWGTVPGASGGSNSVPVLMNGINDAVAVAAGNWHVCAVQDTGSVACWLDWRWGQPNGRGTTNGPVPVFVLDIDNAKAVVGVGSDFSCTASMEGSVECWDGHDVDSTGLRITPVAVPIDGATPSTVAAGYHRACAVSPDGDVQCWSGASSDAPVAVPGLHAVKDIAVGERDVCALLRDGTIQCLSEDQHRELGKTALIVPNISDAVAVSAGAGHTCALLKTGRAWCWGANGYGQLGNGASSVESPPVEVLGF